MEQNCSSWQSTAIRLRQVTLVSMPLMSLMLIFRDCGRQDIGLVRACEADACGQRHVGRRGWFLTGMCVTALAALSGVGTWRQAGDPGLAYNPSITTAVRWHPDKKTASGLITGATACPRWWLPRWLHVVGAV